MRLLAATLFSFFISSNALSKEVCEPESTVSSDIFSCLDEYYKKIDKELNTQYKRAQTDLDIKGLTDVEKEWIKFRDLNCDYIYRSYSPGAESGMEKMSCLISLSSARLSEIAYMRSGVLNDGFNTALYISEEISEEVRGNFIDQVKRRYNLPDNGVYFEKNCRLSESLHGENFELCMTRMKFQNHIR